VYAGPLTENDQIGRELLFIEERVKDLDFRINAMVTAMSIETKAVLNMIQKRFGSDSQGVIDAQDWLISRPREVSPAMYDQLAAFLAAWDARRQNIDRGRKISGSVWWGSRDRPVWNPPAGPDQSTPVVDLTGSGSNSGSGSSSGPTVIDLTGGQETEVVDDYERLKANQKAGKYVGKFKPFGSHKDEL